MPTPKTWTATDIELGKLTITRQPMTLQVERRYQFLDLNQDVLSDVAAGRLVIEIAIADIPAHIIDALQTIDTWTYEQALSQAGMDD